MICLLDSARHCRLFQINSDIYSCRGQALVAKEYNRTIEDTLDMSPEDERQICEYAKKNLNSDFVFITRFPTKKRAFYTYEDPGEAPFSGALIFF